MTSTGRFAPAIAPALWLFAPGQHLGPMIGWLSFWLTVLLALVASGLSAYCIARPVWEPRRDPYAFLGQWFVWLSTPLLWGIVTVSVVFPWLRFLDLVGVAACAVLCRRSAHAICSLKWRSDGAGKRALIAPHGRKTTLQLGH